MRYSVVYILILAMITTACQNKADQNSDENPSNSITAVAETAPVQETDDAADDPAIWVHPQDPSKSLIIGTNKQRGLNVYKLNGMELSSHDFGRINNVDVRYNFPLTDGTIDFAAGSNRTDNSITIVKINSETGELSDIAARKILSNLGEVYGFCLYHDRTENRYYAFVNGKSGEVEQWHLFATPDDKIDAKLVRTFRLDGQPEGCVADDELGFLYIGEEDKGIWKFSAHPDSSDSRILVDDVSSEYLQADIEGITIFYSENGGGYLIVSSQGNNSYAVYERNGINAYIGSFVIVDGEIDGTSETDGIDVCNKFLGRQFPHGIFVAQDGDNYDGDKKLNQNFKLVSWEHIALSFNPDL
jgi:3-phytase